jgi:organic hydroperoxide reductase OsmC/OhrA
MAEYRVRTRWRRETTDFTSDTYDRTHEWEFGGGTRIQASSAPEYRGDARLVNPEEALAAALSSCHMLTFLALAARRRLTVDRYEDEATATLGTNADGRLAVTTVMLRPAVIFGGERRPDAEEIARLHERAHEQCFIANSVRAEVVVEPREA